MVHLYVNFYMLYLRWKVAFDKRWSAYNDKCYESKTIEWTPFVCIWQYFKCVVLSHLLPKTRGNLFIYLFIYLLTLFSIEIYTRFFPFCHSMRVFQLPHLIGEERRDLHTGSYPEWQNKVAKIVWLANSSVQINDAEANFCIDKIMQMT